MVRCVGISIIILQLGGVGRVDAQSPPPATILVGGRRAPGASEVALLLVNFAVRVGFFVVAAEALLENHTHTTTNMRVDWYVQRREHSKHTHTRSRIYTRMKMRARARNENWTHKPRKE